MSLRASLLLFLVSSLDFASAATSHTNWKRDGDVAVNDKWANHDKVVPLAEAPGYDLDGEVQMTFKPLIHSWHGCVPYAAVDADGAAGAGLKPTGKAGGDCRDFGQTGQTYTRIGKSHGRTGIIYSYYLPKVQGNDEQHKHHWITAVVWLAVDKCPDDINNFSPRGVAYSTNPQGAFDTTHTTNTLFVSWENSSTATRPILAYDAGVPLIPSANGPEGALSPPLVAWDRLPAAAKEQLNGIRYEHTRVPFSDANFQGILDSAYSDTFFTGVGPDGTDCGDDTPSQDEIDPDFGDPVASSTAAPEPEATGLSR